MNCPWKLKCPIGWLIYSDYIEKKMLKQTQVISNPGPLDYKTSALSTGPRSLDYSPIKNNEWNTRAPDITNIWLANSLEFGPNTNPHTHTHTHPHTLTHTHTPPPGKRRTNHCTKGTLQPRQENYTTTQHCVRALRTTYMTVLYINNIIIHPWATHCCT